MTKGEPKDVRSTGRKRARKALFRAKRSFKCNYCGKTSQKPPPDAPNDFDDYWPKENRVLEYSLQANHLNKNLLDDDPVNLEWACASCHKLADNATARGVSTKGSDEFGHALY